MATRVFSRPCNSTPRLVRSLSRFRNTSSRFGNASRFRKKAADTITKSHSESLPTQSSPGSLAFAILRPTDRHDSIGAGLDPTRAQRTGPDLFSLVCVAADPQEDAQYDGVRDASFAGAAQDADSNQTLVGGNLNFLIDRKAIEVPDARGPHDASKLQPGAVAVVNVELYHAQPRAWHSLLMSAVG